MVLVLTETNNALHCGDTEDSLSMKAVDDGTQENESQWLANIRRRVGMSTGDHICSGSLIHMKYVLTAAHCFIDGAEPDYYNVILGDHNQKTNGKLQQQTKEIKAITIHAAYNAQTFDNDIALIELKRPVRLNRAVNTICLPIHGLREKSERLCYEWME